MSRKYMPCLREVTHAGIAAENLAVPLLGRTAPLPDESSENCYVAVGATAAEIERHLNNQRNSMPWHRQWICDPTQPNSVKVIAFAYRSVAEYAISAYSECGAPAVAVTKEDLPFLVEDFYHILADEDDAMPLTFGWRLGLVVKWMRQHRYEETMRLLQDPKTAQDACWLLNFRDQLYGRKNVVSIDELPWAVRVTEWDVLPCKAVHPDGSAVFFQGEWKSMPLAAFWSRYCKALMSPHTSLPAIWHYELMRANRTKAQTPEFVEVEDLANVIYGSDVAGPAA
jgi:hypothetical protein